MLKESMPATIKMTKRGRLDGWRCTEIEVKISGFHEKWCPYEGEITLTRKPTRFQQVTVTILLLIGWVLRDMTYRNYVEDWIENTNRKTERLVKSFESDPWGMVEEMLWNPI